MIILHYAMSNLLHQLLSFALLIENMSITCKLKVTNGIRNHYVYHQIQHLVASLPTCS
jgi:hypothetical protein